MLFRSPPAAPAPAPLSRQREQVDRRRLAHPPVPPLLGGGQREPLEGLEPGVELVDDAVRVVGRAVVGDDALGPLPRLARPVAPDLVAHERVDGEAGGGGGGIGCRGSGPAAGLFAALLLGAAAARGGGRELLAPLSAAAAGSGGAAAGARGGGASACPRRCREAGALGLPGASAVASSSGSAAAAAAGARCNPRRRRRRGSAALLGSGAAPGTSVEGGK